MPLVPWKTIPQLQRYGVRNSPSIPQNFCNFFIYLQSYSLKPRRSKIHMQDYIDHNITNENSFINILEQWKHKHWTMLLHCSMLVNVANALYLSHAEYIPRFHRSMWIPTLTGYRGRKDSKRVVTPNIAKGGEEGIVSCWKKRLNGLTTSPMHKEKGWVGV